MNTVSELSTLVLTGDVRIDSLLDSVSPWNFILPYRNTLYYTFDAGNGSYIDQETDTQLSAFNASQQNAARAILNYSGGLIGVNFVEVANSSAADIHFAATNLQGSSVAGLTGISYGYSYFDDTIASLTADATIWLDNVEYAAWNNSPSAGTQGYETLLHEIGHMLGLGHPFNSPNTLPANQDNTNNTVMSYTSAGAPKSAFQQYDLWALTWIYGEDGLGGTWGYNSINGQSLDPSAADTTAPTVLTFFPQDESTDVTVDTDIQITFSETVSRGIGNITLKTEAGQTVEVFNAATSTALSISGSKLTVNPTNALMAGSGYKLELASGTIVDLAGNAYKGTTTYNFTTQAVQDNTAPTIDGLSPIDGASNVAIDTNISLSFTENIALGSGTIVLKTSGGTEIASWNMAANQNLSIAGDDLILELGQNLDYGTQYVLHVPAGAIEDIAGNGFTGKSDYDFSTVAAPDTTSPFITQLSPADNSDNVATDTAITIRFSESIQAGSADILLQTKAGATVETFDPASGSNVTISGNRLILTPSAPLAQDTAYKLVLPAGAITDLAGNPSAAVTSYNFSTAAPDSPIDDFAGDSSTSGELAIDNQIVGELESAGDRDWFSVELSEGENYQFELLGARSGTGTLGESGHSRLVLLNDQGQVLQSANSSADNDPTLLFSPDDSGLYFLSVEGLNGSEVGTYQVKAQQIANNPAEGLVFIYGNALPNEILLAETKGISDTDGLGAFNFQWLRDGAAIGGANTSNYQVTQADVDKAITVRVEYVDGAGFDESLSSDARIPTVPLNDAYTRLIEMYVIILGRAPAQDGLEFWSSKIDDGRTFEDVAAAMWNSPGAQSVYPSSLSDEEKVTTVYHNVLAREPNPEGLDFWLQRWQSEDIGPVGTMLAMINALTANNSADPQAIQDKVLFEAKVDIGGYLATSVGNQDLDLAAFAFDYLEAGNSIEAAKAYIDAEVAVIGQADLAMEGNLI